MTLRLQQINLFVSDFDSMVLFYRNAVGLQINDIDPGPPCVPMVNWVSLSAGSTTVELFDGSVFWDTEVLRRSNRDTVQLCFITDDLERERDRLERSGATVDPVVSEEWGSYASFRDPEGNWLQLFQTKAS